MTRYSELQLDALRELANIGSGNAATALSGLLGRSIDVSVPNALALPLADAVDAAGPAEAIVTGVVLPVYGDLDAIVLLLFTPEDADELTGLLGCEPGSEVALSALGEIGNILGSSYVGPEHVLYRIVQDLAQRANLPMPRVYVSPHEAPNAFATGRSPNHAAVCATEGLLQMLTPNEVAGVMSHELAHVKHRDILIQSVAVTIGAAIGMLHYMAL